MKEEFVPFPPKNKNTPFFIGLAGVSYCDGSYSINRPKSECLCVEYIIEGEGVVVYDGKKYYPEKGDIYLLAPGKDHFYYSSSENPWQKIWINAHGSLIPGLISAYNPQGTALFHASDGLRFFEKIHNIGRSTDIPSEEKHHLSALAVHELFRFLYDLQRANQSEISKEGEFLRDFIDNNIEKNIKLKELSDIVFLSPSQVIRIFKKDFGKTPYDYTIEQKMRRAKLLLESTGLMVKEIAFSLGFSDEHYFSYLFKEKTGKTPTAYRRGETL